jgi:diacylglycerol O-acyltransferase / trehalose O-mycolyltransferase / mycolyltransferase Ag85
MSQTSAGAPASQPRIADRHHVGGRSWDLIIQSLAVGNQVPVRILLPAQYEQRPQQRWPVLYLLHGCCDSYISWTRSTDIEELSANLKALVVMPDGGQAGFYSNWLDGPQWEIFHTQELPQLLAAEYRANSRAAIVGVSMGGLGALVTPPAIPASTPPPPPSAA